MLNINKLLQLEVLTVENSALKVYLAPFLPNINCYNTLLYNK